MGSGRAVLVGMVVVGFALAISCRGALVGEPPVTLDTGLDTVASGDLGIVDVGSDVAFDSHTLDSSTLDVVEVCDWAGKRLCGDMTTGWVEPTEDVSKSMWSFACRGGDPGTDYSYGNDLGPFCNYDRADAGTPAMRPSTELTNCHGTKAPYDKVFNMNGNVREWDLNCFPKFDKTGTFDPAKTTCGTRGGFWGSDGITTKCINGQEIDVRTANDTVGFRCCKKL